MTPYYIVASDVVVVHRCRSVSAGQAIIACHVISAGQVIIACHVINACQVISHPRDHVRSKKVREL